VTLREFEILEAIQRSGPLTPSEVASSPLPHFIESHQHATAILGRMQKRGLVRRADDYPWWHLTDDGREVLAR
jgi:DNA-binding MarR family transcriptional regulator